MADNVAITAGSGTTIAADEAVDGTLGTVKFQYVKLADGDLNGTTKGTIGTRGLHTEMHRLSVFSSTNFTRPNDTTAYASGDLVANSTTAGSVTLLTFASIARASGVSGRVKGARLMKSGNGVTNAAFRMMCEPCELRWN